MKAAFGGAFLIKLMLIFLTLYIAFMAVALNYARGFKVKNQIINLIEQYEGYNGDPASLSYKAIDRYLANSGYFINNPSCGGENINTINNSNGLHGYCVYLNETSRGNYYSVTTFVRLELPFFGIDWKIPIKGETKLIQTF